MLNCVSGNQPNRSCRGSSSHQELRFHDEELVKPFEVLDVYRCAKAKGFAHLLLYLGRYVRALGPLGHRGRAGAVRKITILMNKSVGIEDSNRRIVKVNISGAFVRQSLG